MKPQFGLQLTMTASTVVVFMFMLILNEWIFTRSEFVRGINWVYLPAGARLLCTLLFGGAGAVGILIASWLTCIYYFFPDDFIRSAVGSIISAGAPYLIYLFARRYLGLRGSLSNLTTGPLLICVFAFAIANSGLHHLWFLIEGRPANWNGALVMFIGEVNGSLLVLYTIKLALSCWTTRKPA